MSSKPEAVRRFDAFGLLLLSVGIALAAAAGYAALHFGWFHSFWELAGWLVVCTAFLVVGLPSYVPSTPKNTFVHGAARTATEAEAKAAARGDLKAHDLQKQIFPE